jgi:hypothetical protein
VALVVALLTAEAGVQVAFDQEQVMFQLLQQPLHYLLVAVGLHKQLLHQLEMLELLLFLPHLLVQVEAVVLDFL